MLVKDKIFVFRKLKLIFVISLLKLGGVVTSFGERQDSIADIDFHIGPGIKP